MRNMFRSRLEKTLRGLASDLAEASSANNRLMAVCGMSVEEITDAFVKGYRLVSPKAVKDDIPDDLRIVPKNTREQTKGGIMNIDVMRLKDAIKEARILAGAETERLCNENKYLDACIFQSVRDSMAANIQLLESYEICKEKNGARDKE